MICCKCHNIKCVKMFNYRDALIVTTLDTFTNVLASIAIFGLLGNLARKLNIDNFDEVVKSGTGLAFISYPDAVAKFDWAPQVSQRS